MFSKSKIQVLSYIKKVIHFKIMKSSLTYPCFSKDTQTKLINILASGRKYCIWKSFHCRSLQLQLGFKNGLLSGKMVLNIFFLKVTENSF